MVRRGEYLERAVVIPDPAGGRTLEGLFHRGRKSTGVLIAPASPWEGATMESPIVAELAWALTRAGHPTLRFNYRGVGASPGARPLEPDPEMLESDLELALNHLAECLPSTCSLGACAIGDSALRVLDLAPRRRLDPLLLLAPDPRELPEPAADWPEVALVYPHKWVPPKGLETLWRPKVLAWGERLSRGQVSFIAQADPGFRRGLVELGQLAVHTFSPTGFVDLG